VSFVDETLADLLEDCGRTAEAEALRRESASIVGAAR
jgi:hypothetical protein